MTMARSARTAGSACGQDAGGPSIGFRRLSSAHDQPDRYPPRPSTPPSPTSASTTPSISPSSTSSCASRASAPIPDRADDVRRTAQWIVDELTRHRRRARHDARDERTTRSSPPSGCTPARTRRPCSCTATTTCSPPTRWTSGSARRSSRATRTSGSTPAAPATTRASCSCTSRRSRPGWHRRPAAGQPALLLRGRRGGRLRAGRAVHRRPCRPAAGRRVRRLRRRHVRRRRHAGHRLRPARHRVLGGSRSSGPRQDVHSGQYGGGVDNPANVLVRMLASL